MNISCESFREYADEKVGELEIEDGGFLLRVQSVRQHDGLGLLRHEAESRPLLTKRLPAPYRLRELVPYDATFHFRLAEPLPSGVVGVVCQSDRAARSCPGLSIQAPFQRGTEEGLLRAMVFSFRGVVIDDLFPLAVLRFVKLDVQRKA